MPVKTGIQNSLKTLQYDLVVPVWTAGTPSGWHGFSPGRILRAEMPAIHAGMTEAVDEIKTELDQLSGIVKM